MYLLKYFAGILSAIYTNKPMLGVDIMNITDYQLNENIVLVLDGEFDAAAVKKNQLVFENALEKNDVDILVDFSYVNFIDSSGVGVLVFMYKRLKSKNRKLVMIGLDGQPLKLIQMLRIDKTIESCKFLHTFISSDQELVKAHG